ncbi:MAG: hypothetical protein HQM13_23090 [SAR324 cluster bacterium]|nr:hypothetical protein [SAR324 cluster bacterium]
MLEPDLQSTFCALMAISRGLDMLSTWLVTPKMTLEANPAMKKLRWRTLFLINLPLLGLPFLHPGFSLTMIVLSFLVAGNTLSNAALSRGLGEKSHLKSIKKAVRGNSLPKALGMNTLGGTSVAGAGVLLMSLSEKPWQDLLWWGALGIVCYGLTALLHVNLSLIRLFHRSTNKRSGLKQSGAVSEKFEILPRESKSKQVLLELSSSQYEQINAKAKLFGKGVEEFCQMVIMDSKAKLK